jgi:RNA polymerase sigma factor (sigma-70 family)
MDGPGDVELVHSAWSGDGAALGLLLNRHHAPMRAVALGILGYHPEVEDLVQEACFKAVRRIGDLHDAHAFGAWVRAIVRNECYARIRRRVPVPIQADELEALMPWADGLDPAEVLDRHALGDWVWQALESLSPELRLVTMLRYFTDVAAYDQIALLCGIPIGTVRSRLSRARTALAERLTASSTEFSERSAVVATHWARADNAMRAAHYGDYGDAIAEIWSPEIDMTWGSGKRTFGLDYPERSMARDVGDGVVFRVADVTVGGDIVIWKTDLENPPDDPFHCPPDALWVHSLRADRTVRLRIFHPNRRRGQHGQGRNLSEPRSGLPARADGRNSPPW